MCISNDNGSETVRSNFNEKKDVKQKKQIQSCTSKQPHRRVVRCWSCPVRWDRVTSWNCTRAAITSSQCFGRAHQAKKDAMKKSSSKPYSFSNIQFKSQQKLCQNTDVHCVSKKRHTWCCLYLWQIFTGFQNFFFFTGTLSMQLVLERLLSIPPDLYCVATLLCKTLIVKNHSNHTNIYAKIIFWNNFLQFFILKVKNV